MVRKYTKAIEGREYNTRTNYIWSINDVPTTWRKKTREQVLADGYVFLEDGTAVKAEPEPEEEEEPVEETKVEETEAE